MVVFEFIWLHSVDEGSKIGGGCDGDEGMGSVIGRISGGGYEGLWLEVWW